jgi:hypothetical protein
VVECRDRLAVHLTKGIVLWLDRGIVGLKPRADTRWGGRGEVGGVVGFGEADEKPDRATAGDAGSDLCADEVDGVLDLVGFEA